MGDPGGVPPPGPEKQSDAIAVVDTRREQPRGLRDARTAMYMKQISATAPSSEKAVNPEDHVDRPTHDTGPPTPVALVAHPESATLRRRLRPLAWAALEHLALQAHHSDQGWVAAVGARDIAEGIGVTKDTAARAVSILVAAGLVTRDWVDAPAGRRRSGYRLHLPPALALIDCPKDLDNLNRQHHGCPEGEYTNGAGVAADRIPHRDSTTRRRVTTPGHVQRNGHQPGPVNSPTWDQPALFETPTRSQAECHDHGTSAQTQTPSRKRAGPAKPDKRGTPWLTLTSSSKC